MSDRMQASRETVKVARRGSTRSRRSGRPANRVLELPSVTRGRSSPRSPAPRRWPSTHPAAPRPLTRAGHRPGDIGYPGRRVRAARVPWPRVVPVPRARAARASGSHCTLRRWILPPRMPTASTRRSAYPYSTTRTRGWSEGHVRRCQATAGLRRVVPRGRRRRPSGSAPATSSGMPTTRPMATVWCPRRRVRTARTRPADTTGEDRASTCLPAARRPRREVVTVARVPVPRCITGQVGLVVGECVSVHPVGHQQRIDDEPAAAHTGPARAAARARPTTRP